MEQSIVLLVFQGNKIILNVNTQLQILGFMDRSSCFDTCVIGTVSQAQKVIGIVGVTCA